MAGFDIQRTVRDYLRILFRRKWLFLIPFVLALVVAGWRFTQTPKRYRAQALVKRTDPVLLRQIGLAGRGGQVAETLGVAVAQLQQAERLIPILCGPKHGINYDQRLGIHGGIDDPRWERELPRIRRNMNIGVRAQSRGGATQLISVTYIDADPDLALKICQALTSEYVERDKATIAGKLREAVTVLSAQRREIAETILEPLEEELRTFENEHLGRLPKDFVELSKEKQSLDAEVADLQRQKTNAQRHLDRLKVKRQETPKMRQAGRTLARNPRVDEIEREIRQQESELKRLREVFRDEYPDIQRIKSRIADLKQERAGLPDEIEDRRTEAPNPLWTELNLQVERATQDLARVTDALEAKNEQRERFNSKWRADLASFRRHADLQAKLKDANTRLARLDDQIESNMAELNTQQRKEGIQYEVIQPARLPHHPFSPDPGIYGLMGLLIGVVGGIGLVVLAEYTDHSLRSVSEAARYLGVPVVGTIGIVRSRARHRLHAALRVGKWCLLIAVVAGIVGLAIYAWQEHPAAVKRFLDDPKAMIHAWTGGERT